ncbi:ribosome recycling factor [Patescibacteria group bacterium]|nr:ribosome recycling factor [Patescibacteria group bacterium]MBU1500994.1 ribosome recycling factor [Patescibacteria group bacterium]MBU2080624.1 ribosome recycling factor [Patescibacteria group bacterium]MBU2124301.1 ribosome recycling factor [Patescibacteria group bacterium]MBU2194427.1 ribosome recycling factor [Patescibacteria group bacterium]
MASFDFSKLDASIKETEEWLVRELSSVRTGRATPSILDTVKPEVYGSRQAVHQVASVTIEDARSLRIVPWDKTLTKSIEKAITDADLGVGLATDDQGLRVTFPELTSERRTMLLKVAGEKVEQARITLRGHRTDAIKAIDAAEKEGGMGKDDVTRFKEEVQKKIDKANEALDALGKRKEAEVSQ